MGSTSFKILIATMDSAGKVEPIYEEKRQVKLLSGADFQTIRPEAMQRAHDAMAHFARLAAEQGIPLYAIATAGLRDASNASSLIQSIQEQVCLSDSIFASYQVCSADLMRLLRCVMPHRNCSFGVRCAAVGVSH